MVNINNAVKHIAVGPLSTPKGQNSKATLFFPCHPILLSFSQSRHPSRFLMCAPRKLMCLDYRTEEALSCFLHRQLQSG